MYTQNVRSVWELFLRYNLLYNKYILVRQTPGREYNIPPSPPSTASKPYILINIYYMYEDHVKHTAHDSMIQCGQR